jgi:hypothetical protein
VAESNDDEHETQRDQGNVDAESEKKQGASDEFDERNGEPDRPEGPRGQEGVLVRQEPLLNMAGRSELEYLVPAGHEEDEAENEPGEKEGPASGCWARKAHGDSVTMRLDRWDVITLSNDIEFSGEKEGAQRLTVRDVFDALTTNRAYTAAVLGSYFTAAAEAPRLFPPGAAR